MLTLNAAADEPRPGWHYTIYPPTHGAATSSLPWLRVDRMPTVSLPNMSVAAGCNPNLTYILNFGEQAA